MSAILSRLKGNSKLQLSALNNHPPSFVQLLAYMHVETFLVTRGDTMKYCGLHVHILLSIMTYVHPPTNIL
jgi:hypothetical protein